MDRWTVRILVALAIPGFAALAVARSEQEAETRPKSGSRPEPEELDSVEKAQRLAALRRDARAAIFELSSEERDLEDPEMWDRGIEVFERASALYGQGVALDPASFTLRFEYAAALRGAGLLHLRKHEVAKAELEELKSGGEAPSPEEVTAVSAMRKAAYTWLSRSTEELEFYADHLMKDAPNPAVFTLLEENCRLIGDYPGALAAVRRYQAEFGDTLKPDLRKKLVEVERWYEERISEDQREKPKRP